MKIENLLIETIKPSPRNPRVIPDEAVKQVARSIELYGFLVPLVVEEDNEILAGHTRLKAAQAMKLKSVPCVRASGLTAAQKDAFRLADNRLASIASWDDTALYGILSGMDELPPGFTDDDLDDLKGLLSGDDDTVPDYDHAPVATSAVNPTDMTSVVLRCRRDVYDEAKKRCAEVIAELEK